MRSSVLLRLLPAVVVVCSCSACPPQGEGEGEAAEGEGEARDAGVAEGEGEGEVGEGEGERDAGFAPPFDAGPVDPNPTFDALGDNGVLDLGATALTPPDGEDSFNADAVTDYSGLVYDPNNHVLLMFGGGHATTQTSALYAFSFASLSWAPLYALTPTSDMTCANFNVEHGTWTTPVEQPLSRHTYDSLEAPLAVAGRDREFWMFRSGDAVNGQAAENMAGASGCLLGSDGQPSIYWGNDSRASVYSFDSSSWSFPPSLFGGGFGDDGVEYDPIADELVALGNTGLFIVDLSTKITTQLVDAGNDPGWPNLNYAGHLTYSSIDDAFYYFDRIDQHLWRLLRNRADGTQFTLEQVAFSGPYPPHGEPGFDDDPRHGVLGGAVLDETFYIYQPTIETFVAEPAPGAADLAFHAIAFDPVDNVFVYVGTDRHTWAYRYRVAN